MLGLLPPLAGDVLLDGQPLGSVPVRERARSLAYVPQVHAGTFGFSVAEVVLMGRTAHAGPLSRPSARDQAAAAESLEVLGIAHLSERPYTMISGGERQLTLIARALAQEPRVVVLDDPTASLDFGNQGRVLGTVRRLTQAGLAVLFTTHDPNQALRYADRVLLLRDGCIVFSGESHEAITGDRLEALYRSPVEQVGTGEARAYLPTAPTIKAPPFPAPAGA